MPPINRTDPVSFAGALDSSLAEAARLGQSLALVIVQLDNLDRILATFGYTSCDRVVTEFATRLRAGVRPQDKVLRLGEGRFAVVIEALRNDGILVLAAKKIGKVCARPMQLGSDEIAPSFRIGVATGPGQAPDADRLLQNTEAALLAAFAEDERFAIYAPEQAEQASHSLKLEAELDAALKRKEFELYFQPKISTRDFQPCGAEALMRWNNPERGFVPPDVFVPLADRPGRMEPLTAFLLNAALVQATEWPGSLRLSINLSPRMLQYAELIDVVAGALKLWDFPPERLVIEITEGAVMSDPESSFAVLSALRGLGTQISIDDFGTGYSSFAYFKNIPADELKIDKTFVRNMLDDQGNEKIVRAIIQLSKEFGLKVTAEGVEDEQTARILARYHCDRLQGYHYARPLPQPEFLSWLDDYRLRSMDERHPSAGRA